MSHVGLDIFETERRGCVSKDIDGREILDALALQGVFNLEDGIPFLSMF